MRTPVIIVLGLVVVGLVAGAFWLFGPASAPERGAASGRAAATAPGAPPTASSTAPASRPTPDARPRASGRGAAAGSAADPVAPAPAAPTLATLHVESDVPGATVFIDRVSVGTTPLTIRDLSPGSHQLNVAVPGYDSYGETVNLSAGSRTVHVAFKEIRLDARTMAVHKHGVGSCRGELSATPDGLRFAAADGADDFFVALTDLEVFEIHYAEKNLRVSTRAGRTYNFTTPEETADGLLRFHADVNKARKRILAER